MNIVLWIVQGLLALLCISGGAFQIFKLDELKKNVAAMRELPRGLWALLGAFGIVAGLCLILPMALGVLPVLTPIAAAGVAAQSILISGFYLHYGDRPPLPYSVTMAILAVVVAIGRFAL
jgi:hypothetical protein